MSMCFWWLDIKRHEYFGTTENSSPFKVDIFKQIVSTQITVLVDDSDMLPLSSGFVYLGNLGSNVRASHVQRLNGLL
jgi:hypothetical protein